MEFFVIIFTVLVGGAIFYQCAAGLALLFFLKRRLPRLKEGEGPGVSLLKPVKGLEPDTDDCLASFFRQDYPQMEILFGVADPSDPVMPVLRSLQQQFPEVDSQIIVCPSGLGFNPKISTLRQLLPHTKYELLVISDSDIRVSPDLLTYLAAALQEPGMGMATCLYRHGPVYTPGGALEALSISADFIPSVAMAYYVEGIHFALGAVMAISRPVLEDIGGLEGIADYLADDYQLGYRVSQTGEQVYLLPYVVEILGGRETFADYLSHQLRWARTYRVCRPQGYFAYGITFAFPWGLLAWLTSGLTPALGMLAFFSLLLRLGVVAAAEYGGLGGRLPKRYLALLPFKDLLSFGLWILSFLGDKVIWKGNPYRVRPDGRLERL